MRTLLAVLLLLTGCGAQAAEPEAPLLVAAASDLQPAFTELGELYEQQTGRAVTFTFGSSGQLSQQIVNGAPFEVFAAADAGYVDDVLEAGRGQRSTRAEYAVGRLAIWARSDVPAPTTLAQLVGVRRIAIANPEHAPYGVAARQALQSSGVLDEVQERLVLGESVSDALRLASSGNADVAIVALSLATVREGGRYTQVPAEAHAPLRQALVVTAGQERQPAARLFADLVTSARGRAVLRRYGFAPPVA